MDRGEIWLVSLDPIAGYEQSGKRPVLIVSKASFNALTRLPAVPVTSGGNVTCAAGFAISLDGAGTKTTMIRCDHPRIIDMDARNGKRLEPVPEAIVNQVLARLEAILR
ncbi:TPA: type II toxin-antitoxin system PemK/MazF family toxin [Kluyvera intermedia]|uniref:Pemk protein n=2 Tax=Enterobacteriaceae TaxID=543 RepID=A0AAC8QM74_9ENTR|nr:type II toxin-antitoxin system PemK/MazF family toxin [Phytobacter ursingii]HAT2203409.1 type II toxin-antitoxin system PemK/MazF family toxin [Kluyvera intermedia]AKL11321.1 pemk protein [Phytobacter ursingii]HAT2514122.1 type II toxin-antitoxin system PemK/MazF family toxin [Kluyvera intermedia]HAT2603004.1 type II toxin-antitoxin system PemK/MazF family toxin [Kluyvera intermedia]HAT2679872.1 type II toxin-antitoxin system PemK/MazF family toxin [Kluyvera intermedia]